MLSTFTQGEQMIPVLNKAQTACAVFGNHDFDHGLDVLEKWVKKTNFPWLMSNVIDNETGRPLGDGKISHIIHHNDVKIGLMGLVEKEWLDTLPTIDPNEVTYIDYVQAGNQLADDLLKEGCEIIIALTHMRTPNDMTLAQNCTKLDLILGGHDHIYEIVKVGNLNVIKSGTDFRQFSKISITKSTNENGTNLDVDIEKIDVTSSFEEDAELKADLNHYSQMIESKMGIVLGNFSCELDARYMLFSFLKHFLFSLLNFTLILDLQKYVRVKQTWAIGFAILLWQLPAPTLFSLIVEHFEAIKFTVPGRSP
jgi:5'-nucleotidase